MNPEDKLWKWYERHSHAINTILDIAQDIIPGGKIVYHALKGIHSLWHDNAENKKQEEIQELHQMMSQIKPEISDVVEEIEQNPNFQQAISDKDIQFASKVVQDHFRGEVDDVISKISPIVSMSAKRIQSGAPKIRKVIGQKYEVIRLLGSGGQGEVHEAVDLDANKRVAIKLLPLIFSQDTSAITTLRDEYNRVVDRLVHANIVQYRSMAQDQESGRWFLVMDFVPGSNLRKWLISHREKPLSFRDAIQFLKPIAEALDFAHQNKVVHCDLKPENILIRENDHRLFLTDFGLAKEIHSTLSTKNISEGDISGTLPYMSPEQYLGRWPDERTDTWAFGVILYEIVAGYHPFKGISFTHYKDLICYEQPERPASLQDNEWRLLLQFMEKDRGQRPDVMVDTLNFTIQKEFVPHIPPKEYPVLPQKSNSLSSTPMLAPSQNYSTDAATLRELQEVRDFAKKTPEISKGMPGEIGCWGKMWGLIVGIVVFPFLWIGMGLVATIFDPKLDDVTMLFAAILAIIFSISIGKKAAKRVSLKKK